MCRMRLGLESYLVLVPGAIRKRATVTDTLGDMLRCEMARQGMSQAALARALDLQHGCLGRYMRGVRIPPLSTARQLEHFLGLRSGTLVALAVEAKSRRRMERKSRKGVAPMAEREGLALRLLAEGLPWEQICRQARIGVSTFYRMIREQGVGRERRIEKQRCPHCEILLVECGTDTHPAEWDAETGVCWMCQEELTGKPTLVDLPARDSLTATVHVLEGAGRVHL